MTLGFIYFSPRPNLLPPRENETRVPEENQSVVYPQHDTIYIDLSPLLVPGEN